MATLATPGITPPADLADLVADRAAAEGGRWFPELGPGRVEVRFRGGQARPRCFLYRFDLGSGQTTRSVVVKVRHSEPGLRRVDRFEDRPVLAPVRAMSDRDEAQREYEGLRLIAEALSEDDAPRFGVLRPLAQFPEHAAIVTDFADQPTLRTALLRRSRLRLGRRTAPDYAAWGNTGAWLAAFHAHPTSLALPHRAEDRTQVGDLYGQFAGFLQERLGVRPVLRELASSGADLARHAMSTDLPLGTGHGDFVANNVFAGAGGRITGFDPLPMWRVPVYQDLATLVIGVHVLPAQAATQGFVLPRDVLDRCEAAVLRGYFGTGAVPEAPVLAFQLLVLLDRWSALVSKRARRGGVRPHLREARVRVASRHYENLARRIHGRLVESPPER